MNSRFFALALILTLTGCSSLDVKPAEDGWDQTENKGPGVFTGKKGKLSFRIGEKENAKTPDSGNQATPLPTGSKAAQMDKSTGDFQEFKQWQAWKKEKSSHSDDYLEFRQWLEFKQQKSRQGE